MNTLIQPITEIVGQPQEYGRIRLGHVPKGAKFPKALDKFRLTSADRAVLEQAAEVYGGTVKPWDDPKARVRNQFELFTESSELDVWVPNNGSFSVAYEEWNGGGLVRRCDGVNQYLASAEAEAPCHCSATNLMHCKPKTRASFVLPAFNFGGVWRMDSGSWDVLKEMSGMLTMLGSIAEGQMFVEARLVLTQRSKMKGGQKVRWVVPQLIPSTSAAALQAGALPETPVALSQAQDGQRELAAGAEIIDPETQVVHVVEDDVIDAVEVGGVEVFATKSEAIKAGYTNEQITGSRGHWEARR